MANGNGKLADLDTTADDGQLEEIVPWLYQGSDVSFSTWKRALVLLTEALHLSLPGQATKLSQHAFFPATI